MDVVWRGGAVHYCTTYSMVAGIEECADKTHQPPLLEWAHMHSQPSDHAQLFGLGLLLHSALCERRRPSRPAKFRQAMTRAAVVALATFAQFAGVNGKLPPQR